MAQLYLADLEGSAARPVRALKGFKSVYLEPGQKVKVTFVLEAQDMALVRDDGEVLVKEGSFRLWIGGHNGDALSAKLAGYKAATTVFTVTGNLMLQEA